jgi:exopolysaccharide biosynthesis polyprenyl glycosylphosphotransferase
MKRFMLVIVDIASFWGALLITLAIRYSEEFSQQYGLHAAPFAILAILWMLVFYIDNLYEARYLRNNADFYSNLFTTNIIAGVMALAFFYLIPFFQITPKTNLFIFIGIFSLVSAGTRSLYNSLVETRFKKRAAIVGVSSQCLELARFMQNNPQLGYELQYVVDIAEGADDKIIENIPLISGTHNLRQAIQKDHLDAVILSPEAYQAQHIIDVLFKALEYQVNFYNLASFYEKLTGKIPLAAINQVWFLENITEGTRKLYEIGKRTADFFLAFILGIIFVALFPMIALAIKLDSSGPIFYTQKRLGRAGTIFDILKLRTMRPDAEKLTGAVWTTQNDPRITRVGRFLRKTRIDELPQVINVLKGELSFVGPRTERPEFHETLKKEIPFYEERYLIKPGLTGLSQLYFGYGASVQDAAEKLQYDLYYIKNRSLMLDVGILLKTINLIIRGGGR